MMETEAKNKKGYGHLFIGGTGTGKTTLIKEYLKNANVNSIEIYDVNNEYAEFYNKPFVKQNEFMQRVVNLNNTIIVFEEATIFFDLHSNSDELKEMLVRKRHQNNYIILAFHSIRSIPRYVFDLCNYMTLLKTNDNITYVKNKIPNDVVYNTFVDVRNKKDLSKFTIPGTKIDIKFKTVQLY